MASKSKLKTESPRDEVFEEIFTIMGATGMSPWAVAEKSGISLSTLYNWHNGTTRKPMYPTVRAVLRACGYEIRFERVVMPMTNRQLRRVK